MNTIKIILSVILLILVLIFSFQNMGLMTVNLFNWSLTLPKPLVFFLTYLLGMMTGGLFFTLLRSLIPKKSDDRPIA